MSGHARVRSLLATICGPLRLKSATLSFAAPARLPADHRSTGVQSPRDICARLLGVTASCARRRYATTACAGIRRLRGHARWQAPERSGHDQARELPRELGQQLPAAHGAKRHSPSRCAHRRTGMVSLGDDHILPGTSAARRQGREANIHHVPSATPISSST